MIYYFPLIWIAISVRNASIINRTPNLACPVLVQQPAGCTPHVMKMSFFQVQWPNRCRKHKSTQVDVVCLSYLPGNVVATMVWLLIPSMTFMSREVCRLQRRSKSAASARRSPFILWYACHVHASTTVKHTRVQHLIYTVNPGVTGSKCYSF